MSSSVFWIIWLSVQIIGVPIAFCYGRKIAKFCFGRKIAKENKIKSKDDIDNF